MKVIFHVATILVWILCSSAHSVRAGDGSRAQFVGFKCETMIESHAFPDSPSQAVFLCIIDEDAEPSGATPGGSAAASTSSAPFQFVHQSFPLPANTLRAPTPNRHIAAPPHTP